MARVLTEEPARIRRPEATAAVARPASRAPTARKGSTDAAATPVLTVRISVFCRLAERFQMKWRLSAASFA